MKIKALLAATLLSVAPLSVQAFSVDANSNLASGGTYDIASGPFFWDATFTGNDADGSVSFTFTNNSGSDKHLQVANGTVLQSALGNFSGGVTASWSNGQSAVIPGAFNSLNGGFQISTFLADGASDILTLSWAGSSGFKSNIDVSVAAVPLPAGVLLLGTALVGAGAFASRRKSA